MRASTLPQKTPVIGRQSPLPNRKTIADYVKSANSAIDAAEDPFREFLGQVGSGGDVDFKNNFKGQADSLGGAPYLADAGNFAYGAIAAHRYGSWEIGRQVMFLGAHAYAFAHNKANVTPAGTIFPTDASAARQAGRVSMRDVNKLGLLAFLVLTSCGSTSRVVESKCSAIACFKIYRDNTGGATVDDTVNVAIVSKSATDEKTIFEISNPDSFQVSWVDDGNLRIVYKRGEITKFDNHWTNTRKQSGSVGGDIEIHLTETH
ncbi:hypothetical protein [Sphingomonas sp. PAMC 26605]|uniref:hypothetical protein n=1 Tax=Sphingomonas sp. PAMC 26605 TaxID=1112214 RepID=UPI0012F528EA|nr:hypothetical protein [Sphingomonas sp. PAMC 26605]